MDSPADVLFLIHQDPSVITIGAFTPGSSVEVLPDPNLNLFLDPWVLRTSSDLLLRRSGRFESLVVGIFRQSSSSLTEKNNNFVLKKLYQQYYSRLTHHHRPSM